MAIISLSLKENNIKQMKKILAIGASNSTKSINKKFAIYVAQQIEDAEILIADLNELSLPLFSADLEATNGIPANATKFSELIEAADGIVLSLTEHNGMVTAAFKNLWDWTSRIEMEIWKNKPMLLMAAAPGGRGGTSVLGITKSILPYYGGNVIADFSLPKFHDNFTADGIKDPALNEELNQKIKLFQNAI